MSDHDVPAPRRLTRRTRARRARRGRGRHRASAMRSVSGQHDAASGSARRSRLGPRRPGGCVCNLRRPPPCTDSRRIRLADPTGRRQVDVPARHPGGQVEHLRPRQLRGLPRRPGSRRRRHPRLGGRQPDLRRRRWRTHAVVHEHRRRGMGVDAVRRRDEHDVQVLPHAGQQERARRRKAREGRRRARIRRQQRDRQRHELPPPLRGAPEQRADRTHSR